MTENSHESSDAHISMMGGTFLEDARNRHIVLSAAAQRNVELLVRGWMSDPPLLKRRPTLSLMTTITELVLQEVLEDPHFEEEMSIRGYVSFSTLTYCLSVTTNKIMNRMDLGFKRSERSDDKF